METRKTRGKDTRKGRREDTRKEGGRILGRRTSGDQEGAGEGYMEGEGKESKRERVWILGSSGERTLGRRGEVH